MDEKKDMKSTTSRKSSSGNKRVASKSASNVKKTSGTKKTTASKRTSTVKKNTSSKVNHDKEVVAEKIIETKVETAPKVDKKSEKEETTIFVLRVVSIILAAILVVVAGVKMFIQVRENNYSSYWENKSYLVENKLAKQISCEDISNVIQQGNKFVLVTYFGNADMSEEETKIIEEEFELEKSLAKLIKQNKLEQDFYVYPLIDNCRPIALQNLQVSDLDNAPIILYYRDGKLEYKVEREDELMIHESDFVKLLDIYEITK